jgi:hypothetical protein
LKVQHVEKACLDELGLRERGRDPDERLVRKTQRPFRNGKDITFERKRPEIIEDFSGECLETSQVRNVLILETEVPHIFYERFKTCHDAETAFIRNLSEKIVEIGPLIFFSLYYVTPNHGQLIKIGQKW